MSEYLSQEWLENPRDPVAEAFAAFGASLRIGRIVSKAPDGEARFTAVVADGMVIYQPGVDNAQVTFTDTYANALAQLSGELDPNAAFMRGQTKVTGPTGDLLAVLGAAKGLQFGSIRAEVSAACGL